MKDIWINANKLAKDVIKSQENNPHKDNKIKLNHHQEHMHFLKMILNQDRTDPVEHGYVSSELYEQIKWERDVALDQLESYGIGLGEKAEMERVVYGDWITKYHRDGFPDPYGECSICGFAQSISDRLPRCPNCGMKIRK